MPTSPLRARVSSLVALLLAPSFPACGASGPAEPSPQTASMDPRLASCQQGDSKTCNALGEEQWNQERYASARPFFEVSCARIRPSLEANARRLVELDLEARAAWEVISAGASGAAVIPPEQAQAALDTTKRLQPEADEIKERIEGCTRAGDTWDIDGDHKKALPYYDAMCRLMAIRDRASSIIAGFEYVVGSACDAGHFSREQMASDAQFRARLGGILAQGAQNIAGNVASGMAKVEAAKRGQIVVDSPAQAGPPTALAANASPTVGSDPAQTSAASSGSATAVSLPSDCRTCAQMQCAKETKECNDGVVSGCHLAAACVCDCHQKLGGCGTAPEKLTQCIVTEREAAAKLRGGTGTAVSTEPRKPCQHFGFVPPKPTGDACRDCTADSDERVALCLRNQRIDDANRRNVSCEEGHNTQAGFDQCLSLWRKTPKACGCKTGTTGAPR